MRAVQHGYVPVRHARFVQPLYARGYCFGFGIGCFVVGIHGALPLRQHGNKLLFHADGVFVYQRICGADYLGR